MPTCLRLCIQMRCRWKRWRTKYETEGISTIPSVCAKRRAKLGRLRTSLATAATCRSEAETGARSGTGCAKERGMTMNKYYEETKVADGVYRINGLEGVYMDLFVGTKAALLFDTGYGFGDLKDFVRQLTKLPLIIVNSHGHMDHTSGNYQFDEDIYIHPKDMDFCRETNSVEGRLRTAREGRDKICYPERVKRNIIPEGFDEDAYIRKGAGKLKALEAGQVFDLGGITLEVVELPGHTSGSIGLFHKEEKAFYVSDALNHFTYLFFPEATNLQTYKQTLYKARTIPFEKLYTGHLPVVGTRQTLEDYIDCVENLDFEQGVPYDTPMFPDSGARMCMRKGYTPEDIFKPGFAAVVINKEHLN